MQDIPLSYNKKLTMRWKKEHEEIVVLAGTIMQDYEENKLYALGKDIEKLNKLITEHLMDEDVEFYKFSMLEDSLDTDIKELIEEFVETFEETKLDLMDFLTKYTMQGVTYDQEFIDTFKSLVDVLTKRISYEESNLYKILQEK